MPMTPEEKRKRERERKRRQRMNAKGSATLEALPQIGPASGRRRGTEGGTQGGTSGGTGDASAPPPPTGPTNLSAAEELVAELNIATAAARYRVALILQLARDLDEPSAIPQRSSLAAKYTENVDALLAIAKPKERDELDEMRRMFYQGETGGIDDDPEARGRPARKKA
ncbi:hypothetical protein [Microbacterium foliorum]|uniref:hypothetical protein n=1 Tax=Microbacterium foliorum TaxID=104336 RepID=UPI0009A01E10|nr:hypothetical protein [Microbacterium foliorum]AQY02048.1 hypothetical protein B2G67_11625 [Microbacterium foliorum]